MTPPFWTVFGAVGLLALAFVSVFGGLLLSATASADGWGALASWGIFLAGLALAVAFVAVGYSSGLFAAMGGAS